jgi:hypothetical protein
MSALRNVPPTLAPAVPVVLNRLVVLAAFGLVLACAAGKAFAAGSAVLGVLALVGLSRIMARSRADEHRRKRNSYRALTTLRRGLDLVILGMASLLLAGTIGYDPRVGHDLRTDLEAARAAPTDADALLRYARAGRHLNRPVYGSTTPLDVMRMTRTPGNLLNRVGREFDQRLRVSWEEGEVTPAEHYRGFARGPAWAVDILIRESFEEAGAAGRFGTSRLRASLRRTAEQLFARSLGALSFEEQSQAAERFLKETAEGQYVVAELGPWSRSAAREYRSVSYLLGLPGELVHHLGLGGPWLVVAGLILAGLGARGLGRRSVTADATRPATRAGRSCSPLPSWC